MDQIYALFCQELQSKNGVNPASHKSIARLQKGDGAMSNYKAY